ncbi:hypothetical protein [Fischerella sp. NIES-3754]|uniref:hypothetical protein n=1 Tax=Fischerella sp. NIES-3754 TaxID=1752063 RepID=UPI000720595F|nr:hypothetical protein [Fischerella sp. NIES-3754]BAU06812.1 hypothetical protein FIS3754_27340 [Fischerella sp. NIES-3754]
MINIQAINLRFDLWSATTGNRGNGVSTFLSSTAVLLSTLALVCGGYATYQVLTLQKTLDALDTKISGAIAPSQINNTPAANTNQTSTPAPEVSSSPDVTAQPMYQFPIKIS